MNSTCWRRSQRIEFTQADGKSSPGRWISSDHPDFAWAPGKGQANDGRGNLHNPRLDPKIVEEILGYPP